MIAVKRGILVVGIVLSVSITSFAQNSKDQNRYVAGYTLMTSNSYNGFYLGITRGNWYYGMNAYVGSSYFPYSITMDPHATYSYSKAENDFLSQLESYGIDPEKKDLLIYTAFDVGYCIKGIFYPFAGIALGHAYKGGNITISHGGQYEGTANRLDIVPNAEVGLMIISNSKLPLSGFVKYTTLSNSIGIGLGIKI